MAHTPIKEPTLAEAEEALRKVHLFNAEVRKLDATVKNYVREHGGFTVCTPDGKPILSAYNQQTIMEIFKPELVAEALCELGADDPLRMICTQLLTTANINKLVNKSDYSEHIQARLQNDEDGGMMLHYGSASIEARASAPDPLKHIVVGPGETPRKTGDDMHTQEDE